MTQAQTTATVTASRRQWVWLPFLVMVVFMALLPFLVQPLGITTTLATEILTMSLFALAFNVLLGYTGMVSFGHVAFLGMGAYVAVLSQKHLCPGDVILPILLGAVAATALGAVLGFLMVRARGMYFALLSLAFSQMMFTIIFRWTDVTGGENGLGGIVRPTLLGFNLSDALTFHYFTLLWVVVSAYLIWRLVRSPFGRVLEAIRENDQRAASLGYNTRRYRFVAFVITCFFSGIAGALYAFTIRFVYPEIIHWSAAGNVVFMTIVGGMGSFFGPVLGATLFIGMRDWISSYTENWLIFFGTVFVLFVMFAPDGIMGLLSRYRASRAKATNGQRMIAPAEDLTVGATAAPITLVSGKHVAPGPDAPVVLRADGVTKRFGAMAAVDNVDLEVREREIHAIIGPNGAGKTTLFNCLTGFLVSDGGKVTLKGHDISNLPPYERIDLGLSRSFQIVNIFHQLTVLENVRVAVQAASKHRFDMTSDALGLAHLLKRAREILAIVGLDAKEDVIATNLSHGDQRLLEIGLSLATNPEIILLDEPFAGLTDAERTFMANLITTLGQTHTILVIEHDIDRVLALSDRITVMHQGKVLARGTPEEIQANAEVQSAYLGGFHDVQRKHPFDAQAAQQQPVLLKVDKINTYYGKSHILHDVSLEVRQGEVVALLGRNGVGKTTTLRSIIGVTPPQSGQITYRDTVTSVLPAHTIAQQGIGIVPEGRRVFPNLTVIENLELARRPGKDGKDWTVDSVLALFPRLAERRNAKGDNLSGGERQMLAMARTLMGNVDLLLLDEPFEGLSPAVIADIWHAIDAMRGHVSILLVEHNVSLTLALCDRVYVMSNGQIVYSGDAQSLAANRQLQEDLLGV